MTDIIDKKAMYLKGTGYPLGAVSAEKGIQFTCEIKAYKSIKLDIYNSEHMLMDRIDMLSFRLNDSLASVIVKYKDKRDITYSYVADGQRMRDDYSRCSAYKHKYKDKSEIPDEEKLYTDDFEWEDDKLPGLDFKDIVAYQLHVRGFTAHSSSKVTNRGKFLGIVEKIPYLSDLGINQLVLMPAYDFDEYDRPRKVGPYDCITADIDGKTVSDRMILNYWGFKKGRYMMPKGAYGNDDPVNEFKQMVKSLHRAGIEVIMRFYFPDDVNRFYIPDILRHWADEYHVDGFFLMGNDIPADMLSADLLLRNRKLYFSYLDKEMLTSCRYGYNHNMAVINKDFEVVMRKFLKSDENMLHDFTCRQRLNPSDIHALNNITDYEGFTLNDLVSYDYKHNEANGEDNRDGENFNFSWNCGTEGATGKKSVTSLRNRQVCNAMIFLLMAQAPPMLLMGDELLNTQNGNNNAYCQDNETGWMIWKNTNRSRQMHDFIKKLIRLRKEHPVLRPEYEFRIMDYASCGFPDMSYHQDNAWTPKFDNYLRHIGIMICGKYARIDRLNCDDFFYLAYNMHWTEHILALPKLPQGLKWEVEISSSSDMSGNDAGLMISDENDFVTVPPRTAAVLRSVNINTSEDK